MVNLKNKNIIVLAHILTTVPAQDLKEYFIDKKVKRLLFIGHPLFYVKGRPGPFYELYKKGILAKKVQHNNYKLPGILQYIKDVILTIFWVVKTGGKWDLIIALDNLNTISSLILKIMGVGNKVIYYTIDFVPKRFENKLLNNFYHYLEKLSVKYADNTWNLTERVAEGREKLLGMDRKIYSRQVIVPIGIWFNRIIRKDYEDIKNNTLVYAGGLVPHQGVQLVIDSMPHIAEIIPDIKLNIIGLGSYEKELKKKVKKLKLEKYVQFLGYIEDHKDVENELAKCSLAVAMYSAELSKWSYYADPSKVKTYLATGLPVVTTSVTQISEELVKRKCGLVVNYDKEDLAAAVISIFKDEKKHKLFRKNAIRFASEFDWNNILDKNLSTVLK
jgi:glycosyltransferase involved in cell wall biosynthesis